jgi:hypothetical protein
MPNLYKCSSCGHVIAANARFCTGCRTPGPIARHPNSWRTSEPQWAIDAMLAPERLVGAAAVNPAGYASPATHSSQAVVMVAGQKSSPGLAAILSFFWCGLGQIYTGQIVKGVALMIVYPNLCKRRLVLLVLGRRRCLGGPNAKRFGSRRGVFCDRTRYGCIRMRPLDLRHAECLPDRRGYQ